MLIITDDYVSEVNSTQSVHDDFVNNTDNANDNIELILSTLLLSIPSGVLFLSLKSYYMDNE